MTLALLLAVALAPAGAAAPPAPLRGVGVEETLDAGPVLAPALEQAHTAPGVPVFVRLTVSPREVAGARRAPRARARRAPRPLRRASRCRSCSRWARCPATDQAEAVEGAAARARRHGRAAAYAPTSSPRGPGRAAVRAGLRPEAHRPCRCAPPTPTPSSSRAGCEAADAAWLESLYREDVAAYLDAVAVQAPARDALDGAAALGRPGRDRRARGPDAPAIAVTGIALDDDGEAPRRLADWELRLLGTQGRRPRLRGERRASWRRALPVAAALKDVLTAEIVPLDEKGSSLKLVRAGQDVTASFPHRLLYNVGTFSTYFVYWGGPDAGTETLQIELRESAGKPPLIRDPLKGRQGTAREFLRDPHTKTSRVNVVPVPGPAAAPRLQRRRGRLRLAGRGDGRRAAQRGRDHRAPPGGAGRPGRAGRDLRRRRADGAALPAQRHRPRLRRRHREPLLLRPRGHGVGGAELHAERLEVGRGPPALPAAAAGEGALAAPRPAAEQGLHVQARRAWTRSATGAPTPCGSSPSTARARSTAGRSGSTPRASSSSRCSRCRRSWPRPSSPARRSSTSPPRRTLRRPRRSRCSRAWSASRSCCWRAATSSSSARSASRTSG